MVHLLFGLGDEKFDHADIKKKNNKKDFSREIEAEVRNRVTRHY